MPLKYPRSGHILALDTLRKTMGGKSDLYEFLSMYATRDIQYECFEFTGSSGGLANGEYWILETSGTGNANFAITVASGGYAQGDTGTLDNGTTALFGPIIYSGDENCGMEVRMQSDAVIEANMETGFTDAIEGSNASAVSDVDTPAATASDLAVVQYDTDQTLTTLAFVTDGSTASQNVAATTFVTTTALTAGSYGDFRVQCVGNHAAAWMNGILEADHNVANTQAAGALEGGVLLMPFVYWRTRSTTAKFPKIQYLSVWQDRVA